jgi:KTSC domain
MQRKTVNSSRIKSVGYQDGTLEIEFQGSGRVYQYTGSKVQDHYNGLMAAHENGDSVGRFFNQNIRHCPDTHYKEVKDE